MSSATTSELDTVSIDENPYFWETAEPGPVDLGGFRHPGKALPHRLEESGTYTIVAGGSAATAANGLSYSLERTAVGAYFLSLEQVGTADDTYSLAYAAPPAGHELRGCANFLWSNFVWSGTLARMATRHKNCLIHYPQAAPYIHNNFPPRHYDDWIKDYRAPVAGWYTLRVRSNINANFRGFAYPEAGPFDLMAKVTSSARSATTPALSSSGANASDSRASLVSGTPLTLGYKCGDAPPTGASAGLCWSRNDVGLQAGECESTFEFYDGVPPRCARPFYVARAEATFDASAGDVGCLTVQTPRGASVPAKLELWLEESGKLEFVTTALTAVDGINGDDGLAISGLTLPRTGRYVVRASSTDVPDFPYPDSSFDPNTAPPAMLGITLTLDTSDTCRALKTINTGADAGCASRANVAGWDYCRDPRGVVFSANNSLATFTGDVASLIGKAGVNLTRLELDPTLNSKFYWEVTIGGNRSVIDSNDRQYVSLMGGHKSIGVGIATVLASNNGRLGMDIESAAQNNVYDHGVWSFDGSSNDYGEMMLPGDVISIAFDAANGRLWTARNGYWSPTPGGGRDLAGTMYNNYPWAQSRGSGPTNRPGDTADNYALAQGGSDQISLSDYPGGDRCEEKPCPSWACPYNFTSGWNCAPAEYECVPNPDSASEPHYPFGFCDHPPNKLYYPLGEAKRDNGNGTSKNGNCCPLNSLAPSVSKCPYQLRIGDYENYKARPTCSWGNPLHDVGDANTCSLGGNSGNQASSVTSSALGLSAEKVWYPAVSADVGTTMDLNEGQRPFAHEPPCGYAPLSDLIDGNSNKVGPTAQDCWTCKGECTNWNPSTNTCDTYKSNERFEIFLELGMLPGGQASWANCTTGRDGDCSI